MKMFRKDGGFTLVELMVVVLIIGILVAIAIPVFLNASNGAKYKSCLANQRTYSGAVSTYSAQTGSNFTVAAAGTLSDAANAATEPLFKGANAVMKSVPKCPALEGATGVEGVYHYATGVGAVLDGDTGVATWSTVGAPASSNHQLQ